MVSAVLVAALVVAGAPTAAGAAEVVPGPPTAVSATPGDTEAFVSWTAPADNGAIITGYTVAASPGTVTCATSGVTSCLVTGLTNGTPYAFTVRATGAAGTGSASVASTPVTPATRPGAPTGAVAVPANTQALVSWTAPADDGGSAITGYRVRATPANATCTTSGATSCIVTGLVNSTGYYFSVTATNMVGTSVESTGSAVVLPLPVPEQATSVTATAGNADALVSWTVPAPNGGAAITSYVVTASPGGATCSTEDETSCTVADLSNGTSYQFTVAAINTAGSSLQSDPSAPVTPGLPLTAPTLVSLTPGNMLVTARWTAPLSPGDFAVKGYRVVCSALEGATHPTRITVVSKPYLSTKVAGLSPGVTYRCTVSALDIYGSGPASSPLDVVADRLPGIASAVVVTPADTQFTIGWSAPTMVGVSLPTSYLLTCTPLASAIPGSPPTIVRSVTEVSPGPMMVTVTGVDNGRPYRCVLIGRNAVGWGAPLSRTIVARTTPDPPTGVAWTAGSKAITVTWSPPAFNGGSPITGYVVTCTSGATVRSANASASARTLTMALATGVTYACSLAARNAVGVGSAADAVLTPGLAPIPSG